MFNANLATAYNRDGLKVWWVCACVSRNNFPLQGILYIGKEPNALREQNQGQNVVLKLSLKTFFHH